MKRLALFIVVSGLAAMASAQEADANRVRDAAARALVSIQKAQGPWYTTNKQVCASCQEGDAAINLLLDRGAQVVTPVTPPVFNANPFFLASYAGNAKSLKRLLAAGGKLDEAMIAIGTSRTTPMLGSFKFGDIEVARTLLDLGAPVDFADGNGITMLGRAALNNDLEMARMLISRGANVNVVDKLGMTPLLWASNIDFGDAAMIQLLLGSGAKADVRNKDGLTPLELARKFGHANLIPALEGTKATN